MLHAPPEKPAKRCPNCGSAIVGTRLYCPGPCRLAFHNRMSKRGRVALPIALGWRAGRGVNKTSKAAFTELCRYLDQCNAEDKAANRPPMRAYLEAIETYRGGARWHER